MVTCKLTYTLFTLLGLAAMPAVAGTCAPDDAQYRATFDSLWSASTHPTEFPGNAHFSGLVGGTHNDQVSFWNAGMLATSGIERMAESGSKTVLINEVNAAIAAGTASTVISGSGVGTSPGSVTVDFSVRQAYPLATIVTMIAPSPDWFVGVTGQSLWQDNNWADEVVVDLYPYDAGTDSGSTYASFNEDTDPAVSVAEITGYPFLNNGVVNKIGTLRFQRLSTTCDDNDADGVADDQDNCTVVANTDQRDTDADELGNACDPDIAPMPNDCFVNFQDLNAMRAAFFSMPGTPEWNPNADFDGDQSVNFADLSVMQNLFFATPGPGAINCE